MQKKTSENDDSIVTNHKARSVDKDVTYLTALLKTEVQDKVFVSEAEVIGYMHETKIDSEKLARQEPKSARKNQLKGVLIERVRTGHEIGFD